MKQLDDIINSIEKLYKNLPPLPKSVTDFIVVITPWLALIFGVMGVLGSLMVFGVGTVLSPLIVLGGGVTQAAGLSIAVILSIIISVVTVIAVPSLFSKKAMGWRLLFLSEALSILSAVVSLSLGGVIFPLIWFYVLFQIKSYYK